MPAPTYGGDQLVSMDGTAPLDSDSEAYGAGWMRYIQAALLGWAAVEHNTNGTHKLRGFVSVTAGTTVLSYATHAGKILLCDTSGGNITLTLPAASAWTYASVPVYAVKTTSDTSTVTINRAGADTIEPGAFTSRVLAVQGSMAGLFGDASSKWYNLQTTLFLPGTIPTAAVGTGGTSRLVQRVRTEITATTLISGGTLANRIPEDNTIPQNTEGVEIATAAITPKSASNRIIVRLSVNCKSEGKLVAAFFQDATANSIAAAAFEKGANKCTTVFYEREFSAASLTARTYKAHLGPVGSGDDITLNTTGGGFTLGGVIASFFEVIELEP